MHKSDRTSGIAQGSKISEAPRIDVYECNYHHKMHFITQKNYNNGNVEEHQHIK